MSLLTTLLFPKRTAPPLAATPVIDLKGSNRQGSKPAGMLKARKTLDELKNPVTIMQLMELADISRPTANRALKEFAEVVGTVSVQTTRGVRELKTFRRKSK